MLVTNLLDFGKFFKNDYPYCHTAAALLRVIFSWDVIHELGKTPLTDAKIS
jgi:hypothetical protein